MKRLVLSASALAILSGVALSTAAEAGTYNRYGQLTPYERAAIARSQAHLYQLQRQAWSNGRVNFWERAKLRIAQSRHNALVYRYTHN
jgi:hypothetical protein